MTPTERIVGLRRELAETRAILDSIVLHPTDAEGRRLLAEQLERNSRLAELVNKVAAAISGADGQQSRDASGDDR